jgi:hypothetical protein
MAFPTTLLVALLLSAPAKECKSAFGKTACGYHCIANFGQVKCAQTPQGACKAQFGQVVCWDPPKSARRGNQEQAECKAQFGKIACGYDCVANFGQVKCAQTPEGICKAHAGKVECWDP